MRRFIILAALLAMAVPGRAQARHPSGTCSVIVQMPRRVWGGGLVTGAATLPPDGFLWVLARPHGFAGWWPQGGGPASIEDGRWAVYVTYGVSGQLGPFDVAVVAVGPQANQELREWVQAARPPYPPTDFPPTLPQCQVQTFGVQKVGNE
jgi:hypothetical protein